MFYIFINYEKRICYTICNSLFKRSEEPIKFEITDEIVSEPCKMNTDNLNKVDCYDVFILNSTDRHIIENLHYIQKNLRDKEILKIWINESYRSIENERLHEKINTNLIIFFEYKFNEFYNFNWTNNKSFIYEVIASIKKWRNQQKYEICKKIDVNCYRYYIFDNLAAGVVSHEILGHMMEFDNYYHYKYHKIKSILEGFRLTLYDDPTMIRELGLYLKDDLLVDSKKITIFKDGNFTGDLIGGNYDDGLCIRNFRRSSYLNKVLLRMSSIYVNGKDLCKSKPQIYILISQIKRSNINHQCGTIDFLITESYLVNQGEITFRLPAFSITSKLYEFLSRLTPLDTKKAETMLIRCFKKGQMVNYGINTIDWLLNWKA